HPISGEFTFGATEAADDSGTAATDDAADDSGTAATDDAATTEDEDAGTDEAPAEEQTEAAEAAEAVQDDGGQDGPVGEAPEEGFPWCLIFAVAAVGVALALVVRARRQLQDRPGQEPGRVDQEGDPDLKPDHPSAAGPGSGDPDTAGPDQHDQD